MLQFICSYVLWPFAVVMGVNIEDCRKVAQLIGIKTFLNEFIAYEDLSKLISNREVFDNHTLYGGNWTYVKDDIILYPLEPGYSETVLSNGIISVNTSLLNLLAKH